MSGTTAAAAIRDLIEPWNEAVVARDWSTVLSMCDDDVTFMPPGAPAVSGDAVRPWLAELPKVTSIDWRVDDVQESGTLATIRGPIRQTVETDGEEAHFEGKYCDVFRRGDDGKWRFSLIIWNTDAE